MTPKLRAQLDQIDEWLLEHGGRDLVNVLAAIRGPDEPYNGLKANTTNVIRRAAFPRTFQRALEGDWLPSDQTRHTRDGSSCWQVSGTAAEINYSIAPPGHSSHFITHIEQAAKTLNLLVTKTRFPYL